MKKILLSLITIALVASVTGGATLAQFNDTETSTGNTFSTGSLDLQINKENGPFTMLFSANGMEPGGTYSGGCVTLTNVGSIPGKLTLKVQNPVSNENDVLEPELSDGDVDGAEVDPTSYDGNAGDGELWDQLAIRFFLDTGAGSHTNNGVWDWDDKTLYSNFGTPGNDATGYYKLATDTDLAASANYVLAPQASVHFCTDVHFISKPSDGWDWGHWGSLTNNMAMSDDAKFDLIFGLNQVTP